MPCPNAAQNGGASCYGSLQALPLLLRRVIPDKM